MANYNTLPDDQLVQLYANGDNKAFEVLLMRYKDKLYGYIFSHTKESHLADDIFQETFEKAIIQIKENHYTHQGKFYSWISKIAFSTFIDHYRFADKENLLYDDANEVSLFETKLFDQDSQDPQQLEETIQSIENLIEELPADQRDIIRLRYYDNLSFKEIAAKQSIGINTALGRIHYAIRNLKKKVDSHHITNDMESAY